MADATEAEGRAHLQARREVVQAAAALAARGLEEMAAQPVTAAAAEAMATGTYEAQWPRTGILPVTGQHTLHSSWHSRDHYCPFDIQVSAHVHDHVGNAMP